MNITLTIQEADYGFVVEAIKLRTTSMLQSLDNQVVRQKQAEEAAEHQRKQAAKAAIVEPWETEQEEQKTIVKRRINAPYGLKKDGTPKKRPGRTPS
jgi:hypothetical protein